MNPAAHKTAVYLGAAEPVRSLLGSQHTAPIRPPRDVSPGWALFPPAVFEGAPAPSSWTLGDLVRALTHPGVCSEDIT